MVLAFFMNTSIKTESSKELKTYTACYGTLGFENFLNASCPAGLRITVKAFYALAKYTSIGCPQKQTPENKNPACCQYNANDCSVPFNAESYYQACNGNSSCSVQVSWMETPSDCNSSVYMPRTNYMKMDYYCISELTTIPTIDDDDSHDSEKIGLIVGLSVLFVFLVVCVICIICYIRQKRKGTSTCTDASFSRLCCSERNERGVNKA